MWVASTKKAARQGISCWEQVRPDNAGGQESDLDGQHEFVAVSAKSKGKARKQSAKRLKKRARWLYGAKPLLGIPVPDRMRSSTQARPLGIFGWPTSRCRRQQHASGGCVSLFSIRSMKTQVAQGSAPSEARPLTRPLLVTANRASQHINGIRNHLTYVVNYSYFANKSATHSIPQLVETRLVGLAGNNAKNLETFMTLVDTTNQACEEVPLEVVFWHS